MSSGSLQLLTDPLYGLRKGDLFGASVSVGDIDGDGRDDVMIGVPGEDVLTTKMQKDAGAVDVISGASLL